MDADDEHQKAQLLRELESTFWWARRSDQIAHDSDY
jgi:hypothetical protein